MHFNIRGENIEVTDAIRNHVKAKVGKVEKYFDSEINATAHVKLKVNKNSQKAEITIPMKGLTLRAEEKHEDLYAAIDLVVNKLERQIRKHKTKVNRKFKEQGIKDLYFSQQDSILSEQNNEEEEDMSVKRTKHFTLQPMDAEEAILQMDMLGHDFFLFLDGDSGKICTVYRRNEDSYGLIVTEQ